MDVSVLIPLYQSAPHLETSIAMIDSALAGTPHSYEILLRDDGSTDLTAEILLKVSRHFPRARTFSNGCNQGLGATLRALMGDADGDVLIYCDVDLPFGAAVLPGVIEHLGTSDLVVVSRYAGAVNRVRFWRKITSRSYYGLCQLFFRVPVRDIGSGTVGITRQAANALALGAEGFDIHLELFVQAAAKGLTVREIPAPCFDEGRGSFSIWRHGPMTLARTWALWRRRRDQSGGPAKS